MDYVIALLPSIGTGLLFYIVIRSIVNADRNEREALRRLEDGQPTNLPSESSGPKNVGSPVNETPGSP